MASLKEMRDAANAWAVQEKADIDSGKKKIPLTSREKQMADEKYSDLSPSNSIRPNPPAAAESRMKANKPLKTALVREVEPGRNRSDEALKGGSSGPTSLGNKMKRLQTAAETGEAQAFVGQTVPKPKTGAGKAIRYEQNLPPDMRSSGLGRAEAAQVRSWAGEGEGGQIWGHNKTYVKDVPEKGFKDLGEAAPGASKAQSLRGRAIARSVLENRSETTDAAAKKARTDKAFSEMSQEKAPNQSKVSAGGQRFAPKLTADPRVESELAGQTKSNIERPNKDLGRITTRLIRTAGSEESNISEAGGGILKSALGKRLGQFVAKVGKGASMASKAAGKFGGALGIVGGIAGAADASQQYNDMLNSPNKMDLNTGKVSKRVNPRTET